MSTGLEVRRPVQCEPSGLLVQSCSYSKPSTARFSPTPTFSQRLVFVLQSTSLITTLGGACCRCFLYLNSLNPNGQNCPVTRERMMSVIITMHQNISGQNKTDYIKGGFAQHLYIKGSTRTKARQKSKQESNQRQRCFCPPKTEREIDR